MTDYTTVTPKGKHRRIAAYTKALALIGRAVDEAPPSASDEIREACEAAHRLRNAIWSVRNGR